VTWIRAGLFVAVLGVLAVALTQTAAAPSPLPLAAQQPEAPPTEAPMPSPRPTRIPLPTAPPQMIISRVARETPPPRATATPSAEPRVEIVDNGYLPEQMTVPLGSRVSWANTGGDGHDVTGNGPGGAWRSGILAPSDTYARPFLLAGTFDYWCAVHPEMRGRIVVQP
jgi:plastocyanin